MVWSASTAAVRPARCGDEITRARLSAMPVDSTLNFTGYNTSIHIFGVTVCKTVTVRPMLSDHCLSVCLSVYNVGVLWPNGWMDQDETWHGGRPRPWPHCVRCGPSSPSPKGHSPNFRPMSVVAKRLDGSRCHLVRR